MYSCVPGSWARQRTFGEDGGPMCRERTHESQRRENLSEPDVEDRLRAERPANSDSDQSADFEECVGGIRFAISLNSHQ